MTAETAQPLRYVVFDLETNPDRAVPSEHEIIEIGACLVEDGRIATTWSSLVRPERQLLPEVTELTGLAAAALAGAPGLAEVLPEFLAFLGAHPIVAHNGFGYDFLVLDAACAALGLEAPGGPRLDSLELAHVVFPRAGELLPRGSDGSAPPAGRSLEALAVHLAIADERKHHRALDDARLTVAILTALLRELDGGKPVRALQRWVLRQTGHPWSRFAREPAPKRPKLEEIVPEPPAWVSRGATGKFDPAAAVAPLARGGQLLHSGREYRPQQLAMARLVSGALAHEQRLLVEAPTGTGKTLAYLVPAVAFARASGAAVIVAAHTKVLQNQILATIPELEVAFGPVRAVVLKGRENYVSLEALDGALDGLGIDPDEGLGLATIVGWVATTPTGDWDDLRTWAIERSGRRFDLPRWRLRVDSAPGIPIERLEELCFYRRALDGLLDAEIAIVNHAVLLARDDWRGPAPNLVLDEAHNLEEAATTALSDEVTEASVARILDTVAGSDRRRGTLERYIQATGSERTEPLILAIEEALAACSHSAQALGPILTHYVRERSGARRASVERFGTSWRLRPGTDTERPDYGPVLRATQGLAIQLISLANAFNQLRVPEELRSPYRRKRLEEELRRVGKAARDAAQLLTEIPACRSADVWIHIADLAIAEGRWTWGLRRAPLSVAPMLRELWEGLDSAVLTSATLRVAGEFGHLVDRLGLDGPEVHALESPFEKLHEQHLMVLPDHLPTPRGGLLAEFAQAEADEVVRLLTLSRGRGLVLFTSRARLEAVRDHARPLLEAQQLPVLAQGDAPSPALVERMKTERRSSLLALRSFWEGIDVPGEALSLLVLEKLPFEHPDNPIAAARMEALEARGRDPFAEYLVPQAVIRFVQGLGRLIRSGSDIGVSVVLDNRLRRPVSYREQFLRSLPGPPRILRPLEPEEAYRAIAEHLGVSLDEQVLAKIQALPTSDPWRILDELALSEQEARDRSVVRERLEAVRARFGFASWRPGQLEVMERFIAGEDVLAVLPTGSGKALTFQIPALLLPGLTLVISPLIALMRDQVESLRGLGLARVGAIYSGMPQSEQDEILHGARFGRYKLLYVSPERLWSARFRFALRDVAIARVAVDEAHCVSQWGHSFRPEYVRIPDAVAGLAARGVRPPILAATATATERVRNEITSRLTLRAGTAIVRSPDRPELRYYVERCRDFEDRDLRVVQILDAFRGRPVIVYVPRRDDAQRIASLLQATNHRARGYHAGMEPSSRTAVEEAFRFGETDVVVATKAFGLGIDKPDIEAIVHLEMPASVEEYVQETGRAARGAASGEGPTVGHCVLLAAPRDCRIHDHFIRSAAPDLDTVRRVWEAVAQGQRFFPPEVLAERAGLGADSREMVALAVHHLAEAHVLDRLEDVMWEGRVWVPPDVGRLLDEIERSDAAFARRSRELVAAVEALGTEEYDATSWSRRIGLSPEKLEERLLELHRRDVLGVTAWRYAWQLVRRSGAEPDWSLISTRCQERRALVASLARDAKQYGRQDSDCRRAWLLRYLDTEAPNRCEGCDVCQPDLPRPWAGMKVTRHQLAQALPARQIALGLLQNADGRDFSLERLARALVGSPSASGADGSWLDRHPAVGKLRALRLQEVRSILQALIEDGLAELVEARASSGAPYQALRLTDQGRRWR